MGSAGAPILLCICSQCSAFRRQKQWCPSNWATVRPTLSPNVELALSSTKSLMPNPASSIFCNEHLHDMANVAFVSFFESYRHFYFLSLMSCRRLGQQQVTKKK